MANFYCEYCGQLFSSVASLTNYNGIQMETAKANISFMKEAKSPNILVNIAGKIIRLFKH